MSADIKPLPSDPFVTGQDALARGAWEEARAAFAAALALEETPASLEGLGEAAAWLDETSVMFDARERAYRLYLARGDRRGGARLATTLSLDHFTFRGDLAIANGWMRRALRLLDGLELSPESGWLAIAEAHIAIWSYQFATAQAHGSHALSLGRALEDSNIQMLGLAYEGIALVCQGLIGEGMRCLDEAATAVVSGEMTDIHAACTVCCGLIYACGMVRDYERAAQWCARLEALAERWSYHMMFSLCREYYAGLHMWQGAWRKAEMELVTAIHTLETTRPAQAAEAVVKLAELRRCQGRFEEAADLFERAESPPYRALAGHLYLLGRAALALNQGDPQAAIDLAERFLRAIPGEAQMARAAGLELLIQAWVWRGNQTQAEAALAEFRSVVCAITTKPMRGAVRFAEGVVAANAGDYDVARRCLEDAVELWAHSGAPVETARARIELAGALAAQGRDAVAEEEIRVALKSLRRIGAAHDAARAAALLRRLQAPQRDRAGVARSFPRLTSRETEVLRLVARGLSNKEIAAQLVLSEHTVHRHVSNILAKFGLSSRVAAATFAAQHCIL